MRSEGNTGISLKNPVTPPRIDPGTVRLLAQRFNHYATPGPDPISLQLHLSVYLFLWNYSRVDFATQKPGPGREAPLSTTQPNFSPCYCHSATRKIALPFLRYPHTHNLSSVFYCRSHNAVLLVPSAKFHFCKIYLQHKSSAPLVAYNIYPVPYLSFHAPFNPHTSLH